MHARRTQKMLGSKIMPAEVALASYNVPLPRARITIFDSRDKKTTTCIFTNATYTWRSQVASITSLSFFLESQHGRAHDIASLERRVTCLHTAPLAAQKSYGIGVRQVVDLMRSSGCRYGATSTEIKTAGGRLDGYTVMYTRSEHLVSPLSLHTSAVGEGLTSKVSPSS
jgi:hypothetical protein